MLCAAHLGNLPFNFEVMTMKVYGLSFHGTLPQMDGARCR